MQAAPVLDVAVDAFGDDRLVFGGDWPVSRPYAGWLELVTAWLDRSFSPAQQDSILWSNAERIYSLR
jgi:L-fuconolactonase